MKEIETKTGLLARFLRREGRLGDRLEQRGRAAMVKSAAMMMSDVCSMLLQWCCDAA